MGNVVMPKNSADLEALIPILEFYYNKKTWVENADYISYIKRYFLDHGIDVEEKEPQHYTKRMQVLSYFGFIEWQDKTDQSPRRITSSGIALYEAIKIGNQDIITEIIIASFENTTFGRTNYGAPTSDSDIEAPVLCLRAIIELEYITKSEFAYLLFNMQDRGFTYTSALNEIKNFRNSISQFELPAGAQKYTDWKPITFLERLHILETDKAETRISIEVLKKYKNRIRNLKIYNIDKNIDISTQDLFSDNKKQNTDTSHYTKNFAQTIYYGVPGSGKSHEVDKIIDKNVPNKDDRLNQVIRVVFHPDYTNADFVGQVMPYVNDGIEYRFKAGPFTRILKHAYKEHSKHFYLVIEEINRGNAAAIFGELFQLLDRDNDGFSCYSLNNPDITSFIMSEDYYYNDKILPESVEVGGDKWILDSPIRLPPNLSILATMNTSDQNVFTLDNAFQRRWDMELVPNKLDKEEEKEKHQYQAIIADTDVTWGVFREFINDQISKKSVGTALSSMEDKRLGGWFVKVDDSGNITAEVFANKVLKYLYDDAFKFSRQEIFAEYENFETFHSDFINKTENDRFSIFTDEIKNLLFEANKTAQQDTSSGDNVDAS